MKPFLVNLEEDDLRKLRIAANEEDLNVSQILRKLVRQFLLNRAIAKKEKQELRDAG